jgi:hypothetical protein
VSHEIILKHHGLVRVRSRAAMQDGRPTQTTTGTVFEVFIPDDPAFANEASLTADTQASSPATA